jgi:hypothetical protein
LVLELQNIRNSDCYNWFWSFRSTYSNLELLQFFWRFRITANLGLLTTALELQNYTKFSGVRVVSISTLLSDFRSARIQNSYDAVEKGREGKQNKQTKTKFKLLKKKRIRREGEVPCPQLMQTWILLRPIGDSVGKSAPMCSSSHRK